MGHPHQHRELLRGRTRTVVCYKLKKLLNLPEGRTSPFARAPYPLALLLWMTMSVLVFSDVNV